MNGIFVVECPIHIVQAQRGVAQMENDILWLGDDGGTGHCGSVPGLLVEVVVPADVVEHAVYVGVSFKSYVVKFQFAVPFANDK